MSVNELSRYLLITRQNLTGLLGRLERDGYITRTPSTEDRRSIKVSLSPKGKELWKKLAEPIHQFYDLALKNISFDDRLAMIHYINTLQYNMSKL